MVFGRKGNHRSGVHESCVFTDSVVDLPMGSMAQKGSKYPAYASHGVWLASLPLSLLILHKEHMCIRQQQRNNLP